MVVPLRILRSLCVLAPLAAALQSGAAVGEIKSGLARADAASAYPGRAVTAVHLHREYIWGPGDGAAGVDELWAQYEGPSAGELAGLNAEAVAALTSAVRAVPYWTLQDAGGDVVAVCDSEGPSVATGLHPTGAGGVGVGPATAQTGQVVAQYLYDAYGAVLIAEDLEPHPSFAVGHKGLFADRLDEGITTSGTDPPSSLIPFAATLYDARNRTYAPSLGRWMQRDPNATAQVLIEAVHHSGRSRGAIALAFNASSRAADGFNLYGYLGGNPWQRADPMGLFVLTAKDQADLATGAGIFSALSNLLFSNPVFLIGGANSAVIGGLFGTAYNAGFSSGAGRVFPRGDKLADTGFGWPDRSPNGDGQPPDDDDTRAGGRKGGPETRAQNARIRDYWKSKGWEHKAGVDEKEEYIKPSTGGRRGGSYVDITMTKGDKTVRIQTVDVKKDGSVTQRELDAAARIRAAHPGDTLILIPKGSSQLE